MPILNVKVSGSASAERSQKIANMLSKHTQEILNKNPELISIAISYIDPLHWFVGGKPLVAQMKSSVYVDIKVTDETNTKSEKAKYIKAVFAGFEDLLGDLHHESYIYVEDVRASAYGYGGLTQEYRYQHSDEMNPKFFKLYTVTDDLAN